MGWVATDHYLIDGNAFAVRSTDERFLELVRRYLAPFLGSEGPGDVVFSADCGIEKRLPGGKMLRAVARLYVDALLIYRGSLLDEMAGRLVSGIRDMATAHSNEFFRLRAAGIVLDGGALLLPSAPQPHLPALAALLVRAGGRYLGDELVNLDPVLRNVHGIRLPVLLDVRDLVHFPDLAQPARRRPAGPGEDLGAKTPRRPVGLEELGGEAASPAPVRWLVFPEFREGAPTELQRIGKAQAMFHLSQAALNLHVWGERGLRMMRDLLGGTAIARLVVGSTPEAAALLAAEIPRLSPASPVEGG